MQEAGLYVDRGKVKLGAVTAHLAISALFGLSPDDARYLVSPDSYAVRPVRLITPDHVIAHIRALIANNGRRPRETTDA